MTLQEWTQFFEQVTTDHIPRDVILESWHRSITAGIDVDADVFSLPRVAPADLLERIAANAGMIEAAAPHIEWLATSMARVPHVVYLVDRDGVILHVRAFGIDLEAASLAPGFIWSEGAAGTNGAGTAIAAERPVAVVGCEHIVKAFQSFTCTGAPIHHPNGEVIGAIDVSTRAEDGGPERLIAVAHAAFVIDRELAQRQAVSAAHAATAARDRLLAEVSHEVRTPLTAILGWAQLLRHEPGALHQALEEIVSGAWRLSALVNDLLEMSRIATGKMTLNRADVDLAEVVSAVSSAMQYVAKKAGIALVVRKSGPLVVSGDRSRLEQVITNLLANAVKFTPAGGEVQVILERADGVARVVVSDTGCGIDSELLPRVFDYLQQGEAGKRSGGLGLGLAIVREIIQLHGGKISAFSAGAGQGATFTAEFPRAEQPPHPLSVQSPRREAPASHSATPGSL